LHLDGAAHGIHDAPELDKDAIARPLNYAAMMQSDGGVEQIAAERTKPRKRPLLVGSGKLAVSGNIGRQNGREFAGLNYGSTLSLARVAQLRRSGWLFSFIGHVLLDATKKLFVQAKAEC
jgi:hypothetical protein